MKPPRLSPKLNHERDILFALTKVSYQSDIAEYEAIVKTIYKKLMDTKICPDVGSHWQNIGFQRVDPATDIRGSGMLGILQIVAMLDEYPKSMKAILEHSQDSQYEFPLVCKMLDVTVMCLDRLRSGKLYPWCNQEESKGVFSIVN